MIVAYVQLIDLEIVMIHLKVVDFARLDHWSLFVMMMMMLVYLIVVERVLHVHLEFVFVPLTFLVFFGQLILIDFRIQFGRMLLEIVVYVWKNQLIEWLMI